MTPTQDDHTRSPTAIRKVIVAAIAAVLVVGVAAAVVTQRDEDDVYTAQDLASWCSVARDRDLPVLLRDRFESPEVDDVPVAGTILPGEAARWMILGTVNSIRTDPPAEIAGDVETALGPLSALLEHGDVPPEADQVTAIAAATRVQTHIDQHCGTTSGG